MMRQISLKTLKKLNEQGVRTDWDLSLDNPDSASTTNAGLTVEKRECSRAEDGTKGVLEKMINDPEQISAEDTCKLSFNRDTVHKNLSLSNNNTTVTAMREDTAYPDHPDRFDVYLQLLCGTGLTGRCYWEFEWRGWVEASVSYKGICRRGTSNNCRFGFSAQSWTLECSGPGEGYCVRHDNKRTNLFFASTSGRVAVFMDCPAGTLSFYEVSSDKLIPLHTFRTRFTEPLYPGFGLLSPGSLVSLSAL